MDFDEHCVTLDVKRTSGKLVLLAFKGDIYLFYLLIH